VSNKSCYAVIFTSVLKIPDSKEYQKMARKMSELAKQQPGYVREETARNVDGFGVF